MLIKPKLEYTAWLGDKIEISLQNFAIEQRISGIVFCLNNIFISLPCNVDDQWGGVRVGGGGGMLQLFFLFCHVIRPEDFEVRRLVNLP